MYVYEDEQKGKGMHPLNCNDTFLLHLVTFTYGNLLVGNSSVV